VGAVRVRVVAQTASLAGNERVEQTVNTQAHQVSRARCVMLQQHAMSQNHTSTLCAAFVSKARVVLLLRGVLSGHEASAWSHTTRYIMC
jgi:hypothetical protein